MLNQAMSEETWCNQRGNHKQQRGMQEFIQPIPTQPATPREKLVGVTEEMAMTRQRAREQTRRNNEDKEARSIFGHAWT